MHWRHLWENNIQALEELKQHACSTGYVGIDAEPWVEVS